MELLVHLIIMSILGAIASAIAAHKGRSAVGWFFGGFFLGLIGVVVVACLSNLEEERSRQQRDALERRRLREKLKQEQMKNEGFREHTMQRLDAHDRRLGMDTREPRRLAAPSQPERLLEGPSERTEPRVTEGEDPYWYYEINGETLGPVPQSTIRRMLETGKLKLSALLCMEDREDWLPASQIPCFKGLAKS